MPALQQKRREQSSRAIAELMEQLPRSMVSRSFAHQMNPAQWSALRYLAHANESARHVGGFATHHFTTPSSASQTIGALVKKGLVAKKICTDGRRRMLDLTANGRRMLDHDPINELSDTILNLPDDKLFVLAEAMQLLVQVVAIRRQAEHAATAS